MQNKEAEALRISRLLTPDNRANLLTWVRLACFAEDSARKCLGINTTNSGVSISKPREYSRENSLQRSKK
jgi:hypothetical protein